MSLIDGLLEFMNKNKMIAIIFILVSGFLLIGNNGFFKQTLFMKICKTYQWEECISYTEECKTCYDTCYKTVKDCSRCGYDLHLKATYYCNNVWGCGGLEALGTIKYAYCNGCDDSGCKYTVVVTSNGIDYYYSGKWSYSNANYFKCESGPYNGIKISAYIRECKTCTISYKCNPHKCNCIKICTQTVTKTGELCPPNAINCRCINEVDTCGNGICETKYGENTNNCPQDCKIQKPSNIKINDQDNSFDIGWIVVIVGIITIGYYVYKRYKRLAGVKNV